MNYNDLDKDTQLFLNKAMDIYSIIKDKDICKRVRYVLDAINYKFTRLDKKILSLFISGFLYGGNLTEICSDYDDIKVEDLLEFIDLEEAEIVPMKKEIYEDFFNKNLKIDILRMVRNNFRNENINFITPGVIISSMRFSHISGSKVLDYYGEKYDSSRSPVGFFEHPLFESLKSYTNIEGSVGVNNKKNIQRNFSVFEPNQQECNVDENLKQSNKLQQVSKNIWSSLDTIKTKFIGQEEAVEDLFYNIVNNQQLAEIPDVSDGQRAIIFLDGPTGTGKTAITKEISERLGIPFISTSVTNYSSTGYVGGDITDILKELYYKADKDIEKAQKGIVILDEFDKIAYSQSGGLEMKRAVQQQLLDFLGGGKYNVRIRDDIFFKDEIEFDTSKLTFVCLGALTNLCTEKTEQKNLIGFGHESANSDKQEYKITPQYLINIGLERELVGRFNTYLHTNNYSKELLKKILMESTISPLLGLRKWIESRGKKLEIEEEIYELIAEQAYELNTGARSLQTIINNIRTSFLKDVLRDINSTIYLNSKTILKTNNKMLIRKVRN